MRQKRTKSRKRVKSNKIFIKLAFGLLLPVLSILIGYFGTKYFIAPKLIQSTYVENKTENKGKELINKLVRKNQEKTQELEQNSSNADEQKVYTFELPALSIFNIQVGSFSDINYAQNQVDELDEKGFKGHIIESNGYKVIAMSFLKRDDAEKFRDQIKNNYSDAFISPINLPVRNIKYGEKGKEYSSVAADEIKELIDFYQSFSDFIASNKLENSDTKTVIEFIDSEIIRLSKIENDISKVQPTDEFLNFNKNFTNIVQSTKSMLKKAKEMNLSDRSILYKVFMDSLNRYTTII